MTAIWELAARELQLLLHADHHNQNLMKDDMNNLKCLIECQGEHHYKPAQEFGGINQFENQVKNDELKRTYAKEHNIPLIEIPFTCNTYEKEVKFLKQYNII